MSIARNMVTAFVMVAAIGCAGADATRPGLNDSDLNGVVTPAPAAISISPNNASIEVGGTLTLSSTVTDASGHVLTPSNASLESSWASADPTIVTVTSAGLIRGLRSGRTWIRFKAWNTDSKGSTTTKTDSTQIVVSPAPTSPTPDTTTSGGSTSGGSTSGGSTSGGTTDGGSTSGGSTSGGSSATGAGLTGLALLSDDFSKYASTADLQAKISTVAGGTATSGALYSDGHDAKLAEIDKTVLYNGHPTMKYNQPGGTAASPGLWPSLPKGSYLTKMWLRVKVRYSSNFTTKGTTVGSANAYKLLGWAWDGADGRGTIEFTNTSQYTFNWVVTKSDGSLKAAPAEMNGPNVTTEWTDGQWYEYIVFFEQTSSTTVRERWWMTRDGQPQALKADIRGSMSLGTVPLVQRVMLGLNFNSVRAATQTQALWYGQWEVIDGTKYANPFNLSL